MSNRLQAKLLTLLFFFTIHLRLPHLLSISLINHKQICIPQLFKLCRLNLISSHHTPSNDPTPDATSTTLESPNSHTQLHNH